MRNLILFFLLLFPACKAKHSVQSTSQNFSEMDLPTEFIDINQKLANIDIIFTMFSHTLSGKSSVGLNAFDLASSKVISKPENCQETEWEGELKVGWKAPGIVKLYDYATDTSQNQVVRIEAYSKLSDITKAWVLPCEKEIREQIFSNLFVITPSKVVPKKLEQFPAQASALRFESGKYKRCFSYRDCVQAVMMISEEYLNEPDNFLYQNLFEEVKKDVALLGERKQNRLLWSALWYRVNSFEAQVLLLKSVEKIKKDEFGELKTFYNRGLDSNEYRFIKLRFDALQKIEESELARIGNSLQAINSSPDNPAELWSQMQALQLQFFMPRENFYQIYSNAATRSDEETTNLKMWLGRMLAELEGVYRSVLELKEVNRGAAIYLERLKSGGIDPRSFLEGLKTQVRSKQSGVSYKNAYIALSYFMKFEATMPYRDLWLQDLKFYYSRLDNQDKRMMYVQKLLYESHAFYHAARNQMMQMFVSLGFVDTKEKPNWPEAVKQKLDERNKFYAGMLQRGVDSDLSYASLFKSSKTSLKYNTWYEEVVALTNSHIYLKAYYERLDKKLKDADAGKIQIDNKEELKKFYKVNGEVLAKYLRLACIDRIYQFDQNKEQLITPLPSFFPLTADDATFRCLDEGETNIYDLDKLEDRIEGKVSQAVYALEMQNARMNQFMHLSTATMFVASSFLMGPVLSRVTVYSNRLGNYIVQRMAEGTLKRFLAAEMTKRLTTYIFNSIVTGAIFGVGGGMLDHYTMIAMGLPSQSFFDMDNRTKLVTIGTSMAAMFCLGWVDDAASLIARNATPLISLRGKILESSLQYNRMKNQKFVDVVINGKSSGKVAFDEAIQKGLYQNVNQTLKSKIEAEKLQMITKSGTYYHYIDNFMAVTLDTAMSTAMPYMMNYGAQRFENQSQQVDQAFSKLFEPSFSDYLQWGLSGAIVSRSLMLSTNSIMMKYQKLKHSKSIADQPVDLSKLQANVAKELNIEIGQNIDFGLAVKNYQEKLTSLQKEGQEIVTQLQGDVKINLFESGSLLKLMENGVPPEMVFEFLTISQEKRSAYKKYWDNRENIRNLQQALEDLQSIQLSRDGSDEAPVFTSTQAVYQ